MDDTKQQMVAVPVFVKGQRLRHLPSGAEGTFSRYDPRRAGWVIVSTGKPGAPYYMDTPWTQWEPIDNEAESL